MKFFNKIIEKLYLMQEGNLAYYDSLTGVKTKLYYDRKVKEKYINKNVLVIFIDIDNLKSVNDKYGHHVGNIMIQNIINEIKVLSNILEICRVGGDEFIVIANKDFDLDDIATVKNISFGYALKHKSEDIPTAAKKADYNMYRQKAKKCNHRDK